MLALFQILLLLDIPFGEAFIKTIASQNARCNLANVKRTEMRDKNNWKWSKILENAAFGNIPNRSAQFCFLSPVTFFGRKLKKTTKQHFAMTSV